MKVVICSTRNWYKYISVLIYALLKHNRVKKIYLIIEDDSIPELKDKRIKFININKTKEYITKQSPNYNTKYSKMSYVRCYFSKLINEDKVLYLDADALVVSNLYGLWQMNMSNYAVAGVKEPGKWDRHLKIEGMDDSYINSGVMIMNLNYIREHQLDDKMIELLNNNYYEYPDQDVINIVCKGQIQYLCNIYNSTETTGIVENAKIIHYIRERKGWIPGSPRSEIWFKYYYEMIFKGENMKYKCIVLEDFTYSKANEFIDIVKNGKDNCRVKGDIFICKKEAAMLLSNQKQNPANKVVIKVIEVIPGGEE